MLHARRWYAATVMVDVASPRVWMVKREAAAVSRDQKEPTYLPRYSSTCR